MLKDNRYKHITDLISDADINNIIDAMIKNYDQYGRYYESSQESQILKRYIKNYSQIHNLISITAQAEYDEQEKNCNDVQSIFIHIFNDNVYNIRNYIIKYIVEIIIEIVKDKRKQRVLLRCEKDRKINFSDCIEVLPFCENFEFYKDGGWGIIDKNGIVLLKNNLNTQPSKIKKFISDNRLCVIKDADTDLYGVVSLTTFEVYIPFLYEEIISVNKYFKINKDGKWGYFDETGKKIIECIYDKIDLFDDIETFIKVCKNNKLGLYNIDGKRVFECRYNKIDYINKVGLLKVSKNYKWGCYNIEGKEIIKCKYDEIKFYDRFIECARDGTFRVSDISYKEYESIYDGINDLYTNEGDLLIGGYNLSHICNGLLCFYFGGHYESYETNETVFGETVGLFSYRYNYGDATCLVLDYNFNSILKYENKFYKLPLGKIYNSAYEIQASLPKEILLHHYVNLSDIDMGFIYLINRNSEEFLITEQIDPYNHTYYGYSNFEGWLEHYIVDDRITIIKLSNDKTILWKFDVNGIGKTETGFMLYRIGNRVGFYSEKCFYKPEFSAISTDWHNKIYVAKIKYTNTRDFESCNPNYNIQHKRIIQYFEIMDDGSIQRLEDNWDVFNPVKHQWFPRTFKEDYDIYNDDYYDSDFSSGNEWTDEDAWDAMTDGKFGDYPGSGWDSERWGF